MATHNFELAARMDRILQLSDGLLIEATHRRESRDDALYARADTRYG
jgi:ABC-type transport system involved in cytochrome bd biosynthesis fused ATPase/permease subunit